MADEAFVPENYECPECGEKELLVRGPEGRGPMTREGLVSDLVEDLGGLSPREFFKQLIGDDEADTLEVRLQCEQCSFDENYPADHELIQDIVNNG